MAFTKFDGLIIQEYGELNKVQDDEERWAQAKENAEKTFQEAYLSKIMDTKFPPKAHVHLQGEDGASHRDRLNLLFNRLGYARDALFWTDWDNCWFNWWS